jgi:hypothetical protein
VLCVQATIDGSDRFAITSASAHLLHRTGDMPTGVVFGDHRWRPEQQLVLANRGETTFLPDDAVLASARLRVHEARDTIGLEIGNGIVTVFISDTPPGASVYAFDLLFERRAPPTEITIRARIDGSDELRIDANTLRWQHRHWDPPAAVYVDGEPWNVTAEPLRTHEAWAANLDFRTARVVARDGRDTVCLRIADDHVLVLFADDPPGAGDYCITLRFEAPSH